MATLNEIHDSIDLLTVEVATLKNRLSKESEEMKSLTQLKPEITREIKAGIQGLVGEVRSGVNQIQTQTYNSLSETVKAIEKGAQKLSDPDRYVSKKEVATWFLFLFIGAFATFGVIQQYTVKMVSKNFYKQMQEMTEEPRKEAEKEAKKILDQARKEAKKIIQEAQQTQ